MSGAHLHLLVNHVSLFALVFGFFSLALSMKRKSVDLRLFSSFLFLVAGVFAWVAFQTGGDAADVVKTLGGDTESFINAHVEAAIWAQRSGIFVAALAIAMEWAARKKQKWFKALQWTLLVFALHGCTVFAMTALLGGQIRHTELRN